jgi:hypothetical protein
MSQDKRAEGVIVLLFLAAGILIVCLFYKFIVLAIFGSIIGTFMGKVIAK